MLTEPVLRVCDKMRFAREPFLLALATTANIGSACTLIGNPQVRSLDTMATPGIWWSLPNRTVHSLLSAQNVLIGSYSGLSFGQFFVWVGPAVALGLVLNTAALAVFYRGSLLPDGVLVSLLGAQAAAAVAKLAAELGLTKAREVGFSAMDDGTRSGAGSLQLVPLERKPDGAAKVPTTSGMNLIGSGNSSSSSAPIFDPPEDTTPSPLWSPLSIDPEEEEDEPALTLTLASTDKGGSLDSGSVSVLPSEAPLTNPSKLAEDAKLRKMAGVVVVLLISGFIASFSVAWTALAAVTLLTLGSAVVKGEAFEPTSILKHADMPLLVMIGSLFVVMAGARLTGATEMVRSST